MDALGVVAIILVANPQRHILVATKHEELIAANRRVAAVRSLGSAMKRLDRSQRKIGVTHWCNPSPTLSPLSESLSELLASSMLFRDRAAMVEL